ncbi:MAG: putative glycolipid-binding domain-containing protein [Chitinophagaceae bacterium]
MDTSQHIVVWEGLDWKSMECLCWQQQEEGYVITSHLAGVIDARPFAIHYMIETDHHWNTEHVLVSDLNYPDRTIDLYTDTQGKWFDRDTAIDELEGCLDVDISLTPFTNTLPMRRMSWAGQQPVTIEAAFIKLPEFRIEKSVQHYTRLAADTFLYESGTRDFKARLTVDQDLLVVHYPELAGRIFPPR